MNPTTTTPATRAFFALDPAQADALYAAAEDLLDVATATYYDTHADERVTFCRLCGQWEDHAAGCPVPALEAWRTDVDRAHQEDALFRAHEAARRAR